MNVRLISIKEKYYTDSYGGEYRAFRIVVYINRSISKSTTHKPFSMGSIACCCSVSNVVV